MATPSDTSSLLLFRVGPVLCCAPSLSVSSIILPPSLTHPPGTNAAKPGIFRHGGHIVSSLDLRVQFGVEQDQWLNPGRMIITQLAKGRVGFWIDEILEVIEPPASGWGPLPPLLPRGVFSRTLLLNNEIYLYAEFDALYTIPSHGYLRVYIQHLLEKQARHTATTADKSSARPSSHRLATSSDQERINTDPKPHTVPAQPIAEPATAISTQRQHEQKPAVSNTELVKQIHKTAPLSAQTNSETPASREPAARSPAIKNSSPASLSSIHRKDTTAAKPTATLASPARPATSSAKTATQNSHKPQHETPRVISTRTLPASISSPKQSTPAHQVSAERTNTAGWLFAIFLLMLLAGTTWSVWTISQSELTSSDTADETATSKTVATITESSTTDSSSQANMTQENVASVIVTESTLADVTPGDVTEDSITLPEISTATATDATAQSQRSPTMHELTNNTTKNETVLSANHEIESSVDASPPVSESDTPSVEPDKTVYSATIEQDTQGLTIMIDAPDDADVFKASAASAEDARTADPVDVSHTTTTQSSASQQPASAATPPATQSKPAIKSEVIHIVIKGDTLWHIAIRYLNNPFLYPELAKLSNIKNPDLIYPGNRVRIVKRNKRSEN